MNELGQVTSVTRPHGAQILIDYHDEQKHQVDTVTLPAGKGSLAYEFYPSNAPTGAGQIHYITGPTGGVLGFGYDDGGYLSSESWDGVAAGAPSGTVETERDPEGRIEQQT